MVLESADDVGGPRRTHREGPHAGPPGDSPRRGTSDVVDNWLARRRIERQLHDGPALRISALTLRLGLLSQELPAGSGAHRELDDLRHQLHLVLQELRVISDQIYPPLLYEAGLAPTLDELASRTPVPVRVVTPDDRLAPDAEALGYFVVVELLDTLEEFGRAEAAAIEVASGRPGGDPTLDITLKLTALGHPCVAAVLERIARLGAVGERVTGPTTETIIVRIPCG
jgi:hypothetical protein